MNMFNPGYFESVKDEIENLEMIDVKSKFEGVEDFVKYFKVKNTKYICGIINSPV